MSQTEDLLFPPDYTILFVAPFYNRSGYGMGARALVGKWHQSGLPVRILAVDEVEDGINDFDISLLKQLEQTPVSGKVVAVFYYLPMQDWLDLALPHGSLRVMLTTFDGVLQGDNPPADWIRVCNNMDLVYVNQLEIEAWCGAGLNSERVRPLTIPHMWLNNPKLPAPLFGKRHTTFRFLTIAMFQPRRRWGTLMEAFLQEFADDDQAELYIKVNYPPWHPVAGQPQRDLAALVADAKSKHPSKAQIIVDESLGTRREICELIDSAACYVSTDTAPTGPLAESLIRGKLLIVPRSVSKMYPANSTILIEEDLDYKKPLNASVLQYQPHHKGKTMPLLKTCDVRTALRNAHKIENVQKGLPWEGWSDLIEQLENDARAWTHLFVEYIRKAAGARQADTRINLCWEGSQFVYHSLAHVNRQLCLRLATADSIKLRIQPYETDQFDPRKELPAAAPLVDCVRKPLDRVDVHLRHQWPPNFTAPDNGAWVMIQPWEFGGIPLEWLEPMRDRVDEIWVPTHWVRDCYIKSGIPAQKVFVVPNGVDPDIFSPEGPKLRLKTSKTFRFLFLGGTIHRKGIDVALEAYLRVFSANDDVCLVIKGQPGTVYQGTELDTLIRSIQDNRPDAPEIEYTNVALTESEMGAIYCSCDVLVHPYRGEGFGLPIAEAMASGLPVIITRNGAARDFTDESFAYFVSSMPRNTKVDQFTPTAPGFWLEEPNIDEVAQSMRYAFSNRHDVAEKGKRAREYAVKNLSWDKAASKALERIQALSKTNPCRFHNKKTGFVFEADWHSQDWLEVLVSYISEFLAGEPVSLILPVLPAHKDAGIDAQTAVHLVSTALSQTGQSAFPDIVVTDDLAEWIQLQKSHDLQWVAKEAGSTVGLNGMTGQRLGKARLLYSAANR